MLGSSAAGWQGDLAVGQVSDAHVDAENARDCVGANGRAVRAVELGDWEGGQQAGCENWFGAAGGEARRSRNGFELCGFEGGEPC